MTSEHNCTGAQMIPGPQMIPKLDGKWSRTGNDPNIGPQVIKDKNEEWYAFILEEGENKYKKLWKTLSYL